MDKKQKVISSLLALFLVLSIAIIPITNVEIKGIQANAMSGGATGSNNERPTDVDWNLSGNYGIQADDAWEIQSASHPVKVGVIDTGFSNPYAQGSTNSLNFNVEAGRDFYAGDGCTDTCIHNNEPDNLDEFFNSYSTNVSDRDTHGTHVAGVIGAINNTDVSFFWGSQSVTIIPLKDTDDYGIPSLCALDTAIRYATWAGIDILNISQGFRLWYLETQLALTYSIANSINNFRGLIVCAAGNDGINTDLDDPDKYYPAAYEANNIISVGAIDSNGNLCSYDNWETNYGKTTVDLFAPGADIISTYPNNYCGENCQSNKHYAEGYHYNSGTSMAAPHVAGVAAMLLSQNPNLTTAELKEIILNTVVYDSRYAGKCVTGGRLNAYKALLNVVFHTLETPAYEIGTGFEVDISDGSLIMVIPSVSGYYEITSYCTYGALPLAIGLYDADLVYLVYGFYLPQYQTHNGYVYLEEGEEYVIWFGTQNGITGGYIYLSLVPDT